MQRFLGGLSCENEVEVILNILVRLKTRFKVILFIIIYLFSSTIELCNIIKLYNLKCPLCEMMANLTIYPLLIIFENTLYFSAYLLFRFI